MTGYRAILSARFRILLQYRAAAAAGFGTQLFWGLIRVMIFDAFYRSSGASQPMTYAEVVTYVWLGQALLTMLPWTMDVEVRNMVRTGTVAYELLRPLDLYSVWFVRSLAARAAPALLRSVPMFVVAGLFLGLQPPPSWSSGIAWVVVTATALLLSAALSALITITLLWTISGEGLARLLPALAYLLSGLLIPLPLFPDWMQPVLDFLPFRGLLDVPFRVYLGHIPVEQLGSVLAHQLGWTAALILLGRHFLARGLGRLVVQGG